MPQLDSIFWLLVVLAFLLGVQLMRWWQRRTQKSSNKVNQEYFKGLNFLLNEEPDKAIEVFIKALEVDSETVELHLALGGLFRRKGQVDRATRIHQNLIARPSLTEEQRLQAIYELAQDYYKAGLLDRAENLFEELKEFDSYRALALEGLCNIYQQEKEWAQAIEVCKLHKWSERGQHSKRIAHYWCELAELAIESSRFDEAGKAIKSALAEDRTAARAVLLRGELNFRQEKFRKALDYWLSLSASNPRLANLVVERIIRCYQKLGDDSALENYLLEQAPIPRDEDSFAFWVSVLESVIGAQEAQKQIFKQVSDEGLSGPVANYLAARAAVGEITSERQRALLERFLDRAKNRRIEYTCGGCGFDTKALYWLCPNCGEWDSFS